MSIRLPIDSLTNFLRLKDACVLLTLPSSATITQKANMHVKEEISSAFISRKTISDVNSVLFDADAELTLVLRLLEDLGIHHITASEAQEIVGRRIDCWK